MANPATTTEQLLQRIADTNDEIRDLLRQQLGHGQADEPAPDATVPPAKGAGRRPSKKSQVPGPRKGEVRGD